MRRLGRVSTASASPVAPKTSRKAIASLVFGLLVYVFPAPVFAVVFGHWSRSEIRASAGRLKGAWIAMAGLVLGYISLLATPILGWFWYFLAGIAFYVIPIFIIAGLIAGYIADVKDKRNLKENVLNPDARTT
jgi:hypothetical protein